MRCIAPLRAAGACGAACAALARWPQTDHTHGWALHSVRSRGSSCSAALVQRRTAVPRCESGRRTGAQSPRAAHRGRSSSPVSHAQVTLGGQPRNSPLTRALLAGGGRGPSPLLPPPPRGVDEARVWGCTRPPRRRARLRAVRRTWRGAGTWRRCGRVAPRHLSARITGLWHASGWAAGVRSAPRGRDAPLWR